ncbi:hypothetical protein ACPVPU_07440 [Sphingomonas sp. CJ99]
MRPGKDEAQAWLDADRLAMRALVAAIVLSIVVLGLAFWGMLS